MRTDTKDLVVDTIRRSLSKFREAFEIKFITLDILYVQVQKYLNLRQKYMTVKEFFMRLNALIGYALGVAYIEKGKINIFIIKLGSNIAKDMLYYMKAFGRAQRLDIAKMRGPTKV